ncbi:MAG TPA: helix-turn-helix transcriptional regulator [Verrucomicrobiae bacterium]
MIDKPKINRTEHIKALRAGGAKLVEIAEKFGVTKQRVWTILNPPPPRSRRLPRRPRPFKQRPELSPRQNEVARLVVNGLSNSEISAELGITVGTVKATVHAIYNRIGASKRIDLIVWSERR